MKRFSHPEKVRRSCSLAWILRANSLACMYFSLVLVLVLIFFFGSRTLKSCNMRNKISAIKDEAILKMSESLVEFQRDFIFFHHGWTMMQFAVFRVESRNEFWVLIFLFVRDFLTDNCLSRARIASKMTRLHVADKSQRAREESYQIIDK